MSAHLEQVGFANLKTSAKTDMEYFYSAFNSKIVSIKMAKRWAIRIPGMRKSLSNKQLMWLAAGALGIGALYFILRPGGQDVGVPIIDTTLGQLGDITGLEGEGPQLLPQIFGTPAPVATAPAPMAGEPAYSDWRFTNAYPAFENYDEIRFSNAYKNE